MKRRHRKPPRPAVSFRLPFKPGPIYAREHDISELTITLGGGHDEHMQLYGPGDNHLRMIREALGVRIFARGPNLKLAGDSNAVGKAAAVFEDLQARLKSNGDLTEDDVTEALGTIGGDPSESQDFISVFRRSAAVKPRTEGQKEYVRAMLENDLCICVGPAGTGKTYLAVAVAIGLLKAGKIKRIILARPAVEAGEKLGYLPGDLQAKVNPYLRPLFDAMHDMMDYDQIKRFVANDVIEVCPLAYMRGRTLNNSAIILDEAQNATPQQTLMFLTRLGHHSKMIITGDESQSDLEGRQRSGLSDAARRLSGVEGIAVIRLSNTDIVRHRLVTRIVQAYNMDVPPGAPIE
ncbi:MAG TPA: PhoH family protein [Phycisphaerae bacterium]|nr:PhoH family protein [Phycisphaerae bacterium]